MITKDELDKLLSVKSEVEKITSISSDGKNLLSRIPKDVREYFSLKKGDKLRWMINEGKICIEPIKGHERKRAINRRNR